MFRLQHVRKHTLTFHMITFKRIPSVGKNMQAKGANERKTTNIQLINLQFEIEYLELQQQTRKQRDRKRPSMRRWEQKHSHIIELNLTHSEQKCRELVHCLSISMKIRLNLIFTSNQNDMCILEQNDSSIIYMLSGKFCANALDYIVLNMTKRLSFM